MNQELVTKLKAQAVRALGGGVGSDYSSYADDLVQDTLLYLYERDITEEREQQALATGFIAWRANNLIRNESNRRRIELESGKEINKEVDGSRSYTTVDPLDALESTEIVERLANLSPTLSYTFEEYHFNGKSIEEIADASGVSTASIYKRLERARELLQGK